MAAYNKFETFAGDLAGKVHDLVGTTPGTDCDILKIYLSNAAPSASADSVKTDLAEISAGNGYTAGGEAVTNNGSESGGTFTLTGTDVTWNASSGTIGPFQYVVLYNDTSASPTDPLIAWWDYGSALTLNDGESFSVQFGANIFTLS